MLEGRAFACSIVLYLFCTLWHINSHNRFRALERSLAGGIGGSNLRELRLNGCLLTWDQVSLLLTVSWAYYLSILFFAHSFAFIAHDWHSLTNNSQVLMIAPSFPSLRSVELGLCQLQNLEATSPNLVGTAEKPLFPLLESLNFDTNNLSDWVGVCRGVKIFLRCVMSSRWRLTFPIKQIYSHLDDRLSRLILISNAISTISPLAASPLNSPLLSVTSLSLQSNHISQWSDVDNLHEWLPNLENLGMADNPVLGKYSRLFLIGRLAGLKMVQGGKVRWPLISDPVIRLRWTQFLVPFG